MPLRLSAVRFAVRWHPNTPSPSMAWRARPVAIVLRRIAAVSKDRHSCNFGCSEAVRAISKPKRHYGLPRALTRHSRTLGTTSVTCWMSKDALKPPLNAYAQRCDSRPTTLMQRSILPCCCNKQINLPKRRITGVAISPVIANRNGPHD